MNGTGVTLRADQDGAFNVDSIRPGTYHVLAMDPGRMDYRDYEDRDRLRELSLRAQRVTSTRAERRMSRFSWMSRKAALALACLLLSPLGATAQGITGGGRFVPPPDQRPVMPPRDMSGRPRGAEAPATGTASISGRVVDADTGTPLRRVTVGARAASARHAQSGRMMVGETDETGAYVLRNLPAGQYTVTVQRAGYVTQSYGQATATSVLRRVSVEDGRRITAIDFRLVRGGAITGRVVDDGGEPAEGVAVRVMRAQRVQGRVRYVPAGARTDITDDLGQFRLYGLAPGEYLVAAEPNVRRSMGGPAPSAEPDATHVVTTYAPGTSTPADAQRFVLAAGQDLSAEIQLVASRVATVSGRVIDSSGAPLEGGVVRLQPQDVEVMAGRESNRAGIVGGAFRLERVVPGAYTLTAMGAGRRPVGGADQGAPLESASLPVMVSGDGVEGLVVTTAPPSTLTGRVVVEGDAAALDARALRIAARSTEPDPSAGAFGSGRVSDDLTVRVTGLRGSQRLSVTGLPRGWWVKSVRLNGQDALEGLDFGTGRQWTGLEIVVNDRPAFIGGQVTTAGGQPATDYAVLAFPQDFEARASLQLPGVSAMSRPDQSGTWVVESLRPGDYFVLATAPGAVDMSVLDDHEALQALSERARRVTVREGDQQVLNLTLVEP